MCYVFLWLINNDIKNQVAGVSVYPGQVYIVSYIDTYKRFFLYHMYRVLILSQYYWLQQCLWVPVTTAWRVLRLWMGEQPPIWRVAANKLNKQSMTADKGWSSSLGVGRGANNSSPWKRKLLRNTHRRDASSGDKTIRR